MKDLLGHDPDLADAAEIDALLRRLDKLERPTGGFRMSISDNPWLFNVRSAKGEAKSAQHHYKCLPFHVINAMGQKVSKLCATDSIHGMWATSPLLLKQIDTLQRWGFKYAGLWPWFKGSPLSEGDDPTDEEWNPAFGTGYIGRSCSEFLIIGTRGEPVLLPSAKSLRAAFFNPQREHSRKPDEQYTHAEALSPGPYLELFSRTDRPGWVSFGDQTGRFNKENENGTERKN